jgi:diacylglycerol O-acyltransferase / wax synthase
MERLSGFDASFLYLESEDKHFDVNRHLHRIAVPTRRGRRELADICGNIASSALDRGPIFHGEGLNITAPSHDGKLDFGIISCPDLLPDLWGLADQFPLALKQLLVAKP